MLPVPKFWQNWEPESQKIDLPFNTALSTNCAELCHYQMLRQFRHFYLDKGKQYEKEETQNYCSENKKKVARVSNRKWRNPKLLFCKQKR
jgi:hypothetical protein